MSYIPLSVIKNAVGSEMDLFYTLKQIADQLALDKQDLIDALESKGVILGGSESLDDLIAIVAGLAVNFNLQPSEVFSASVAAPGADSATATLFSAVFETASENFTYAQPTLPTDTGVIWNTEKWNVVMTNNTTPANYVASASSEETGFEAYKAFENTNATSNDAWLTATGNVTGYVQYQDVLNSAVITEYKITSRNAASGSDEAPQNWTFEGSNNGTTWFVLDTRTGVLFGDNETKTFSFTNTTSYSYYKLDVTLNGGSVNFVAVGELELRSSPGGTISF